MSRFVVHAGFTKTGSTSIQNAIGTRLKLLESRAIYMMGADLRVGRDGNHPGLPLWTLEKFQKSAPSDASLTSRIVDEINNLEKFVQNPTIVLSAENLSQPAMPALFRGLDEIIPVEIVFYMRPQKDWIPSAWKQWGVKTGETLREFVASCLKIGLPFYKRTLDAWSTQLPKAKITVRQFFGETLIGGDPSRDFFSLIGLSPEAVGPVAPANLGVDYSLLHIMSKNRSIMFNGLHDNLMERALRKVILPEYCKINIAMLPVNLQADIEEQFRDENMEILKAYLSGSHGDLQAFYDLHYRPVDRGPSYLDMDEIDVLCRAYRIIVESGVAHHGGIAAADDMVDSLCRGFRTLVQSGATRRGAYTSLADMMMALTKDDRGRIKLAQRGTAATS